MEEKILDYDRDWEYLKTELLSDLPEDQRDGMLTWIVLQAIFN